MKLIKCVLKSVIKSVSRCVIKQSVIILHPGRKRRVSDGGMATMNSPDIPLDIQLLVHTLCMWRQAAQAGARIVHPTSYLEPVQRAGGRGSWLQSPNSTHSAFECWTRNNSQQRRHKGLPTIKVINFSFWERKSTCYVQNNSPLPLIVLSLCGKWLKYPKLILPYPLQSCYNVAND